MKDVLKYATTMPGVQSVMMDLGPLMQMLHVGSLDCPEVVSVARLIITSIKVSLLL